MTQLTLQRQSFGFVPADDETRKAFAKVPIGSLVTREWRKVRNSKHHRMRFAWVPEIFAAIEHLGLFGNAELLRAHLTLQTEFVHVIVNPSTGEVSRIPRSWAYSSLDENEFVEMAKQIRDYLLGDFLDLCIERGKWDDNTVLHFQMVADQ
mgnify:FL=1